MPPTQRRRLAVGHERACAVDHDEHREARVEAPADRSTAPRGRTPPRRAAGPPTRRGRAPQARDLVGGPAATVDGRARRRSRGPGARRRPRRSRSPDHSSRIDRSVGSCSSTTERALPDRVREPGRGPAPHRRRARGRGRASRRASRPCPASAPSRRSASTPMSRVKPRCTGRARAPPMPRSCRAPAPGARRRTGRRGGRARAGAGPRRQLDQQRRVRAVRGDVLGAEPRDRVGLDRVAEQAAVGQHGQANGLVPEHRRGRSHPVLGLVARRRPGAAQVGDLATARVEPVGRLVGGQEQRPHAVLRCRCGRPCARSRPGSSTGAPACGRSRSGPNSGALVGSTPST